jgi:membrane protein DedA with SNARE-associated domain
MSLELLLLAVSTFLSEDLACIAAGVWIAQGRFGFTEATLACLLGIVGGDLLLFLIGRLAAAGVARWEWLHRFVPEAKVRKGAEWIERRGMVVVLLSRFTPGLRLPTYLAAGFLKAPVLAFAGYFLLAAAVWTPLLVGAAALIGGEVLNSVFERTSHTVAAFAGTVLVLGLVMQIGWTLVRFERRRRLIGFLKRKTQWEFWPPWLAYLPVVPWIVYLMARHRSATVFTAANPTIPSGGFVGESKTEILEGLRASGKTVAEYVALPAGESLLQRLQAAQAFQATYGFPIVLKPDVGERGSGVRVIRTWQELEGLLGETLGEAMLLQRYVEGLEFGVFYYRYPGEEQGRIFAITAKHFPHVTGDGASSLRDLILKDDRAVCMVNAYEQSAPMGLDEVPGVGERVKLVEIGSHCRGSIFLDGTFLKTPALEEAIDRVTKTYKEFYFGRYDLRSESVDALRRGEFTVIELNGVSAEATHIYDPAVSLWAAYRSLFEQWRIAFEIGAANRARGFEPMPLGELATLIRKRLQPAKEKPSMETRRDQVVAERAHRASAR